MYVCVYVYECTRVTPRCVCFIFYTSSCSHGPRFLFCRNKRDALELRNRCAHLNQCAQKFFFTYKLL